MVKVYQLTAMKLDSAHFLHMLSRHVVTSLSLASLPITPFNLYLIKLIVSLTFI